MRVLSSSWSWICARVLTPQGLFHGAVFVLALLLHMLCPPHDALLVTLGAVGGAGIVFVYVLLQFP